MKRLLIAVAIREELKLIKKFLENKSYGPSNDKLMGTISGFPVEVFLTSMGMAPAKKAAAAHVDPLIHGGVLGLGYCGGLSPSFKTGDALVASKLISNQAPGGIQEISLELNLCESLGRALISEGLNYRIAALTTQDRVLEKPDDKKLLLKTLRAEGVDMESYEIADQARIRDLRSAIVKFVVDDAEMELPPFNEILAADGKLDQLQIKQVLLNHPALSLRLRQCMKRAAVCFEKGVPSMIGTVCRHWGIPKQ